MPILQPAETWEKTGRYAIDELFKLEDRKGSPMVLAMTHEEAVTDHVAREVRSYRDLPLMLFHIQTKERDEPRPRAGVLRTREFTMKDAYSFDRDEEGLARSYELQAGAYERIFDRCGLRWYRVESDVGMMGGTGAHEYMAPCAGRRERGRARRRATRPTSRSPRPSRSRSSCQPPLDAPEEVATPGLTTVEEVAGALGAARRRPDQGAAGRGRGPRPGPRPAPRRPPPQRDQAAQRARRRLPPGRRRGDRGGDRPGRLHRPGRRRACRCSRTRRSTASPTSTGANRPDAHLRGVRPGRDFEFEEVDVRTVEAGDTAPGGGTIEIEPAIEVGNIFKLGTRYSEPLGATYLDEEGKEQPIVMGCYGIGPARIAAAAIEQGADERGIVWPPSIAPWQVHLVSLAKAGEEEREAADRLYEELRERCSGRGPLRRPRRRARREADRRRAARLPAAARGRPPRPRRGRRRGARPGAGADAGRGAANVRRLLEEAARACRGARSQGLEPPRARASAERAPRRRSAGAGSGASSGSTAAGRRRARPRRGNRSTPGRSPTSSATPRLAGDPALPLPRLRIRRRPRSPRRRSSSG